MTWPLSSKLFPSVSLEMELINLLAQYGRERVVDACLTLGHVSLKSAAASPKQTPDCKRDADEYARFAWCILKEEGLLKVVSPAPRNKG